MNGTFEIGGTVLTYAQAALAASALAATILIVMLLVAWRRAVARSERGTVLELQFSELVRAQSEMQGRMKTIAEVFGSRQSDLVKGLSERMDGLGHKLGQSLTDNTRRTHDDLSRLAERLAVIDKAQQNITSLSSQVVELQKVLSNKQTRGAFGEARMQAIIQDGLPNGAYRFQAPLSNGNRPDCLILFPNGAPSLVVDAKFPLEGWNAIRAAETPEANKAAETAFRRDVIKHVQDIASRYQIVGETHDTAFMFVPSESIFADIHERFEDVIQRAHRARVVIVSPSLLMLSVQVVMSLLRDVADARAGARHPARGGQAARRRLPSRRPGPPATDPFRPGQQGHRGDLDLEPQDPEARQRHHRRRDRAREAAGAEAPVAGQQRWSAGTAVPPLRGRSLEAPAALEERDLLGRRFAAEHGVAVGEAAELADDVAVLGGEVETVARGLRPAVRRVNSHPCEQVGRTVLVGDVLAVLERHGDEGLLVRGRSGRDRGRSVGRR